MIFPLPSPTREDTEAVGPVGPCRRKRAGSKASLDRPESAKQVSKSTNHDRHLPTGLRSGGKITDFFFQVTGAFFAGTSTAFITFENTGLDPFQADETILPSSDRLAPGFAREKDSYSQNVFLYCLA